MTTKSPEPYPVTSAGFWRSPAQHIATLCPRRGCLRLGLMMRAPPAVRFAVQATEAIVRAALPSCGREDRWVGLLAIMALDLNPDAAEALCRALLAELGRKEARA